MAKPGSVEKEKELFSSPLFLPNAPPPVKDAKGKGKGKGKATKSDSPKPSTSSASLSDSAILPKRKGTFTFVRPGSELSDVPSHKDKPIDGPSKAKKPTVVDLRSPSCSPAKSGGAPVPLISQDQLAQVATMVAGLFSGGLGPFTVSTPASSGSVKSSGVGLQPSSGSDQRQGDGFASSSCTFPRSETSSQPVSGRGSYTEFDVVSQAGPDALGQTGQNCGIVRAGHGSLSAADTVRSPFRSDGAGVQRPYGWGAAPLPLAGSGFAGDRYRSGTGTAVNTAMRSDNTSEERIAVTVFADGESGFPDRVDSLRHTDGASVSELPYGNYAFPKSGCTVQKEAGLISEDARGDLAPSLSPPRLCRHDQDMHDAYGPALADADQPEASPSSEVAYLLKGLQIAAHLDPALVRRTPSVTRPGFSTFLREDALQFAPHPVIGSWMNYHWNVMRNQKSLGASPWTPDAWPLASWPRPAIALPMPRPVLRHQALVEDPSVPPPCGPTDAELLALRKPGLPVKGYQPSGQDKNLLLLEAHLQVALDGLQASAALTAALSRALKDDEDPDKLSSAPDSAAILDLLDALPAALSVVSRGLTATRVVSTVARRDALMLQTETDKAAADKLRVLPLASGSLFGPYVKQSLESGPAAAPVSADEFARALVRAMPTAPKPKPAQQGWGGGRAPQQPRGKGKQQQKPKGRWHGPKQSGKGGNSGKKNPPPPPRQGN